MRMLPAAIIASLALSSTAFAGSWDKLTASAESVELSGAVELDLFGDRHGNGPGVFVMGYTSGDDDATAFPMQLQTVSRLSGMTKGLADELGLDVKTLKVNELELEYAVVPELWLGTDRQIRVVDLPVVVGANSAADTADLDTIDEHIAINLAQLGTAWAVRPSTGKVHIAPATDGASLLSAVGGTQVSFTSMASEKIQYGKDKGWTLPMPYLVDGSIGGQDVSLGIYLGGVSAVSNQVELPEAPVVEYGDLDISWQPVALGDVELDHDWVAIDSAFRVLDVENPVRMGVVGANALGSFDIAVDPAGTMALAPAEKQQRRSPLAGYLEAADADLAECVEPPEDAPADEELAPAAERCASQYADIAELKLADGDLDGAIDAWKTITGDETNARDCTNWLSYGDLQLAAGDLDGAIASFDKASAQYHAWWDMEAYERIDAQKAFDKLDEEEQDAAERRPQADACHVADGRLAAAYFAKGDGDKVAELYEQHLDLDPGLAAVYGSELILANDLEAAHGPLRMVEHLTLGAALRAKPGLGRVFTLQNDWESASANYQRSLRDDPTALTTTGMWVQDMARALGPDEALTQARKWAGQRPDFLAAWYGVAVAAKVAGKDPQFVVRDADPVFEDALRMAPNDDYINAAWARFLVATGRAGMGVKVAEKAVELAPDSAQAWLSLAMAQEASGKGDAKASYARAVANGAQQTAFALVRPKAQ